MSALMKKVMVNGLLLLMEFILRIFSLAPGIKEIALSERCSVLIAPQYKNYTVMNSLELREFREIPRDSKSRRFLFQGRRPFQCEWKPVCGDNPGADADQKIQGIRERHH
jgi:hypothetical protein